MKSASAAALPAPHRAPRWLFALPCLLAAAMLGCLLLARVRANDHLFWSIAGCGGGLLLWQLLLWWRASRRGVPLRIEPSPPIRQHYIQAAVQTCLYLFWGYWWQQDGVRPIYVQAPLILAQFAWLYAFDALFAWSRGKAWRLGSGPTPIVLSTNLFIWFQDDWFVWQFAMVTAGLLGKEFVKWTKDGRRTHIFNPSGFGLACAATLLIATGTTDLTWAKSLATTIEVPGIYLFLFALGLVVQHFFAVTLMTFAAALVMVGINLLYTQLTGVWLFGSTNLPAAAFLGLHLLMTDPSTSPRTNVGRTLFGAGYGLGYVIAFEVLGRLGAPELYAKLYPVPILNCCVQWFDRLARGRWLGALNARWETARPPRVTNAVHMAAWAAVFTVMVGTGYVYALTPTDHPGNSIAFWKRAVAEERHDAARKLVMVAGSQAVAPKDARMAADAYNELGILSLAGDVDATSEKTRHASAGRWWAEAAARGSDEAVLNIVAHFLYFGLYRSNQELEAALTALQRQAALPAASAVPAAALLLALVHETGDGGQRKADPVKALALYRRCGSDLLAQKGLARLGLAPGSLVDLAAVAPALLAAAAGGDGESCFYLAHMHALGRGVPADATQAATLWQRAVTLGFPPAVEAKAAVGTVPPYAAPKRRFLQRPAWATAFPVDG